MAEVEPEKGDPAEEEVAEAAEEAVPTEVETTLLQQPNKEAPALH